MTRSLAFLRSAIACETVSGPKHCPEVVRIVDASGRVSVWRLASIWADGPSRTFYVKE